MKVLIATDFSVGSERLIDCLADRTWGQGVALKFVTVLEPQPEASEDGLHFQMEGRRQAASQLCERAARILSNAAPHTDVSYKVLFGRPDEAIVSLASGWPADKIILGAQTTEGDPVHLLGHVAKSIINSAPCVVDVIRATDSLSPVM